MTQHRRWYDKDPVLKEALELLCMSPGDVKDEAAAFILNLQEQVAGDVIERVYETLSTYGEKGNRWYDEDPLLMKAVEMLRQAPPATQRIAAKKLLLALSKDDFESIDTDFTKE